MFRLQSWLKGILAIALAIPLSAHAGSSLGTVAVGSSGGGMATVKIGVAGKLDSISVRTKGVEGLDFTLGTGGSCAAGVSYAVDSFCTVKVIFKPSGTGNRRGAVVLFDSSGTAMGTGYFSAIGSGPQIGIVTGAMNATGVTALSWSPSSGRHGVEVDGAGNLVNWAYLSAGTISVAKWSLSKGIYDSGAKIDSLDSAISPMGPSMDGAGNVVVWPSNNSWSDYAEIYSGKAGSYKTAIKTVSSWTDSWVGSKFSTTFDDAGNLYVASGLDYIYKLPFVKQSSIGTPTGILMENTYVDVQGLAVDGGGNIYASESASKFNPIPNGTDFKLTLGSDGNYTQATMSTGVTNQDDVAVDGNGNVYLSTDTAVYRLSPTTSGGYTQAKLLTGHGGALAVDLNGNLFTDGGAYKLDFNNPPTLSFASTGYGQRGTAQALTVYNNGNLPLTLGTITVPTDFALGTAGTDECKSGLAIAAGGSCHLHLVLAPTSSLGTATSATRTGKLTIASNSLNKSAAVQSVSLTGIETLPVPTVTIASSANPSLTSSGTTFTSTVTSTTGSPTGTVSFYSGTTLLGKVTLASGTASFTTSTLAAGSYNIYAHYNGDANYKAAVSAYVTQTIGQGTTAVILSSSKNPSTLGSGVTITAKVTGVAVGTLPTGTVTFYQGTATLGTGTLTSGKATYSTSSLPVGSSTISAFYSGDTLYSGAVSSVLSQTVTASPAATPVLSPVGGKYAANQAVSITDATAGATIYYTTDGSTPTTASAVYSSPIVLAGESETVKAIATSSTTTASAMASGSYYLASTPSIIVGPASSVTSSSVMLNAQVYTNYNFDVKIVFKYGLSATALNTQALTSTITAGNATAGGFQRINFTLNGLTSKTTYYYQVTGTTSAGTSTSTVQSFTTK